MIGISNSISANQARQFVQEYKETLLDEIYKEIKERATNGRNYYEAAKISRFIKVGLGLTIEDQPIFIKDVVKKLVEDGYRVVLHTQPGRYKNRVTIYW